jgi:hypothetical protein
MQNIPQDIEQKLDQLPIIPFEQSEDFQRVLMSTEFDAIFNYYMTNFSNEKIKNQTEIYQRISLYLHLTNQSEEYLEQADDLLYIRPIPTIEEFLDNNFYLGLQSGTMYPYWRKKLCEIFAPNSIIKRVLWSGATGTGKTVTARKAVIYSLYKLFCLRHPRAVLKVEEGSTLAVFILSVTQKTAEQTNFNPLLQILRNMPCFQEVRSMTSFENFDISNPRCPIPYYVSKSDLTIHFVNNIILTVGSQISNTVGYDIVISAADEVNEKGVEEGMELLNSIDGRLDSRFSGSSFTFQNVMSSARSTASVTREYNKKWQHDASFLYLHPMRFEVKQGTDFSGDGSNFPILIGNGMIPSSIITDPGIMKQIEDNTYEPPTGCEIVQVPDIYRPLFEADLEQQIQDTLGIDTKDTQSVFRDTSMLEDNRLLPELHMEANLGDNSILSEHLPKNLIIKRNEFNDREELSRAPNALRYCHCDLSTSGGQCDTGICMLHKEWKLNPITRQKDTIYVVDMLLYITAKNKIDLNAVQKLMTDLVTEYKYPIHTISTDQYQSELMRQNWIGTKCFKKVAKVSVDAKLEPYTNAAGLIEDGKVKVGKCPKLIRELEALVIQGGKVERTTELKDLADAIVGAIYDAQSNYDDFPQYEYKDTLNPNKTDYAQHFEELGQMLVAI